MKPRTIEAFETSDGELFTSYKKACDHQTDIIGECLDNLLAEDGRGNVTRTDRFNILTAMLADPELEQKVSALYRAVRFDEVPQ